MTRLRRKESSSTRLKPPAAESIELSRMLDWSMFVVGLDTEKPSELDEREGERRLLL